MVAQCAYRCYAPRNGIMYVEPDAPVITFIIKYMHKTLATIAGVAMLATALPVAAQTGTTGANPTTQNTRQSVNTVCVQAAVDVREASIGTAFTTFSTAVSAALSARKTALHNAWGLTDAKARRDARNKAWSDFRTANRAAYKALRDAKNATWKAFKEASRVCGTPVVESSDAEGFGSLGL